MNQEELAIYKSEMYEIAVAHIEEAIADYRSFLAGTYKPVKFFAVATPPTLDGMMRCIDNATGYLRALRSRSDAEWQAVRADALSESY